MSALLRSRNVHNFLLRGVRLYTFSVADNNELRARLMTEIKTALKAKDSFTATALRSVLADVQAADKVHKDGQVGASVIHAIIGKGIIRRNDAAAKFTKANRSELAEKERREADILQKFLPPAISESQIEQMLKDAIDNLPPTGSQRSLGQVFKAFYAKVDKSMVRPDVVKQKALALLAATSVPPSRS